MEITRNSINILILCLLLIQLGCSDEDKDETKQSGSDTIKKPVIVVSNYPLFYITERLTTRADIIFPAEDSGDPAYWKPNTEDISIMQKANLIILNGAGYEKWLSTISIPTTKIINSLKGFDDQLIKLTDKVTHSHGLEGKHEHSETAFTTWLDYKLCVQQAEKVKDALILFIPSIKKEVEQNFISLKSDLEAIDAKMQAVASNFKGKTLYASHPVYQYLSKAYNLNIISEHWEPDQIPDELMWEDFEKVLASSKATIMLWEDTPLPEVSERLIGYGVKPIVFNPCGNRPQDGDFVRVMNKNIEALNSSMKINK